MKPVQFSDRIGDDVLISLVIDATKRLHRVKLVGVEAGGLWIQSQELTTMLLRSSGVATHPKTPVIFVPYHQIFLAAASTDEVALDEKAFGV
jgi:hypothetical protein